MNPDQYCAHIAAQSGSSLYYSFLFLPPAQRRAITALHAFRREVDEIVNECTDEGVAHAKLAWWRIQISAIYDGQPQHPVAQALVAAAHSFALPQENMQEIIDGIEGDLAQRRYANFAALRLNCLRVAGVVGQLSARIFGYRESNTTKYAENLGVAFRLTDMIRDVGDDARRNRIYLPLDEVTRYHVTVADILHARESGGFRQLMEFQIERALGYYCDAFRLLPAEDRKSQRPGLAMAAIYQAVLNEIRTEGSSVLKQRTSLTPLRKLWIAWRTWVRG